MYHVLSDQPSGPHKLHATFESNCNMAWALPTYASNYDAHFGRGWMIFAKLGSCLGEVQGHMNLDVCGDTPHHRRTD